MKTNEAWLAMTRGRTGDWSHVRRLASMAHKSLPLRTVYRVGTGPRIVLANGCYDVLHPGHVENLAEAADLGDFLVVSIDADEDVLELKGRRPVLPSAGRAFMLACLPFVQAVTWHTRETTVGEDHSLPALIRFLEPDVWAARADDLPSEELKAAADVDAQVARLARHGYWSSSGLIGAARAPYAP